MFGELLEGQSTLKRLEDEAASSDGTPAVKVLVEACGELGSGETDAPADQPAEAGEPAVV